MTLILAQQWRLSPQDERRQLKVPFRLTRSYQELRLAFSYTPSQVVPAEALPVITAALPTAFTATERAKLQAADFLPLDNLITVSLACGADYLGCYHNKSATQQLWVTGDQASWGLLPHEIAAGPWEVQLSTHCLRSHLAEVNLRIEAI